VGVTVKKLLILLFIGFFVGNAFAEEQLERSADPKTQVESKDPDKAADKRPENNGKNTAKPIDIKVSDTADSASAWVTEILVQRGEWVQSGNVVAILTAGEKEVYVISEDTGVVKKVLAARGDSVSRGASLIQLKKVNIKRPRFQLAWRLFSLMNVSVPSVGKRIGGKVKQNIDIPEIDDGKWTNACSVRISFVLNNTGFPIERGKYSTVSGVNGKLYIYRLDEMISYLRDIFGDPDIVVNSIPRPEDFSGMQGILVVTGDGRGDARGHATLWNGSTCSDICHLAGDENNVTFSPRKAVLWVLP